jgi:uncharacterized protein (TIGR03086 family)
MTAPTVTAVAAVTTDLVSAVPAGWGGWPTPCDAWDVATLTSHIGQVVAALDLIGHGRAIPAGHWDRPGAAVTLGEDWAMPSGVVDVGGMTMPAEQAVAMLLADVVLHGWDLARALGKTVSWPAEAVRITRDFVAATAEQGRGMGLYAAAVPVPPGAPELDHALGLSGRDPGWTTRPGAQAPGPV